MGLMLAYWAALGLSCLYVGLRGGTAERTCVAAVAICSLATAMLVSPLDQRFHAVEWPIFGVDLCLLFILVAIVIRSRLFWPLWATGFQIVSLVSNTAALSTVSPRAYALAQGFWAYAILASAIVGTWAREGG